jgi:23S rRNA pseudouridine2604 synthase
MATLKLKPVPKKAAATDRPVARTPVRGTGNGVRRRPTLAEAQAERAEREASWQRDHQDRAASASTAPKRAATHRQSPYQKTSSKGDVDRLPVRSDAYPQPARSVPGYQPAAKPQPRRPAGSAPNTAFGRPASQPHGPANRDEQDTGLETRDSRRAGGAVTRDRERSAQRARESHAQPTAAPSWSGSEPPEHLPGSMRLSKRMSELGLASRREADEWIEKGWVRVDGQVVRELGSRVVVGQQITIDTPARQMQAQKVTVLLNKPMGYVSGQAEDGYEPAFVLVTPQNQWSEDSSATRFSRDHLRSLVPAGRLDIDSVGLLVLTQDGRVAKTLIGENSPVEKEYLVRVQSLSGEALPDALSKDQLALLNHGLELDDEALRPAKVEWVNEDQLRFVLVEGKKRQIRRMCEAVGLKVTGLKRVRIGRVMLGDLPVGQWRYLRADEAF